MNSGILICVNMSGSKKHLHLFGRLQWFSRLVQSKILEPIGFTTSPIATKVNRRCSHVCIRKNKNTYTLSNLEQ